MTRPRKQTSSNEAFSTALWGILRQQFGPDLQCSVLVVTTLNDAHVLRQNTFMVTPPDAKVIK